MSDSVRAHRRQPNRLPLSLGFSRQEHWSGFPFPSPMHESEKGKWSHSVVWLLATPWTEAYQAPPSMGFSRQEYWSGCHCLLWNLLPNFKQIYLLPLPFHLPSSTRQGSYLYQQIICSSTAPLWWKVYYHNRGHSLEKLYNDWSSSQLLLLPALPSPLTP